MPIAGFKVGDPVLTPAGSAATVTAVRRVGGRERVTVRYEVGLKANRTFLASALRWRGPR